MRKLLEIERGDWAAIVAHVRQETGLKTGPLSDKAGVSPETWWRWEKRGQKPKEADVVERFAKGFDLETDDAMWAAGLLIEDPAQGIDPRLAGLDPNDKVVQTILALDVSDERKARMLNRRRQILADRERADLEEIEFLVEPGTEAV